MENESNGADSRNGFRYKQVFLRHAAATDCTHQADSESMTSRYCEMFTVSGMLFRISEALAALNIAPPSGDHSYKMMHRAINRVGSMDKS
ncbi:MAG: hypothetical protein A3I66_08500 [Burkholderiales bacterium RIFCSPLOWO2_02_FULL_57_36]|nr:MAG: hypothetical protein A3I66_08500 [Burkholderiales bacterium RIFCSPLOWO2_02_FULL_57_36]